jgi:uncharacterized protein (TIGR00255 family)
MTGYFFKSFSSKNAEYQFEIKSVNSKYSQINIKLQKHFSFLEPQLIKKVQERFNRGKIDVSLKVNMLEKSFFSYTIDEVGAESFYESLDKLRNRLNIIDIIKMSDILSMEDFLIFDINEEARKNIEEESIFFLTEALNQLILIREREGTQISKLLRTFIHEIEQNVKNIEEYASSFKDYYKNRIKKNLFEFLKDTDIDYSEQRLEFELALLAEKADIQEEIDRLKIHISAMKKIIGSDNTGESVGAKMDFFCQELVREVNTIGSKNKLKEISLLVVEQKSLINSLREQVQNVQ